MTKKKILVIDDEVAFARMVKLNLEDTGQYEVRVENRGSKGLAAAKEFMPDLIFLDIVMPDMDGGEVCRQIGMDQKLKDIPIVFLTEIMTEAETAIRKTVMGGHPLMAKPVDKEKLVECIQKNMKTPGIGGVSK